MAEKKLTVTDIVRMASQGRIGRFTKQDIRVLCLSLSESSIEGALRKFAANGELRKEGVGKSTCYIRMI